jgi:peptide/nickel transport system permease protein
MDVKRRIQEFKMGMGPRIKEAKFILRRIKKSPLSIAGIAIIMFFAIMALMAPVLAPPVLRDPFRIWRDGIGSTPRPPGSPVLNYSQGIAALKLGYTTHIFGTTSGQYDIYYGAIWGTITAFRIGLLVMAGSLIIGCIIGLLAAYYGGLLDEILMRFTDIIFAFPGLILAMALVIALPKDWYIDTFVVTFSIVHYVSFALIGAKILKLSSGKTLIFGLIGVAIFLSLYTYTPLNVPSSWIYRISLTKLDKALFALTIVGWPGYARLMRGEALRIRQEDYIEAAKASGCSDSRIILRHILPNSVYPILVTASMDIGGIVLLAAALSFLGIGAEMGYADWGQMISFARNNMDMALTNWYTFFIPGFFILFFVLGWNLLGDALRDILDPMLRRR